MKRGTLVAVCHDGKYGRRRQGVVIGTRNGHHIKVRFTAPEGTVVEAWFRKGAPAECTFVQKRKPYTTFSIRFSGWVDIKYFCPWFAIYKWRTHENDN